MKEPFYSDKIHWRTVYEAKQLELIKNIEQQLKNGHLNLSEDTDSEEISLIKRLVRLHRRHITTGR